jgi:anti-anti-sigma regulatory factor
MEIRFEEAQGKVPVTIMHLCGQLDASNYLDVIARAKERHDGGTQDLLLDLSEVAFMASSGLVALHSVALIMSGAQPPDPEYGWAAFRTMGRDVHSGIAEHCKLLNPQPSVVKTLELTGFKAFVDIYTDREQALAAF